MTNVIPTVGYVSWELNPTSQPPTFGDVLIDGTARLLVTNVDNAGDVEVVCIAASMKFDGGGWEWEVGISEWVSSMFVASHSEAIPA